MVTSNIDLDLFEDLSSLDWRQPDLLKILVLQEDKLGQLICSKFRELRLVSIRHVVCDPVKQNLRLGGGILRNEGGKVTGFRRYHADNLTYLIRLTLDE